MLDDLNKELQEVKADRGALKDMVLALTTAVTGLMEMGAAVTPSGLVSNDIDACLAAHAAAINGPLDSIRHKLKGGGSKWAGVGSPGKRRPWIG